MQRRESSGGGDAMEVDDAAEPRSATVEPALLSGRCGACGGMQWPCACATAAAAEAADVEMEPADLGDTRVRRRVAPRQIAARNAAIKSLSAIRKSLKPVAQVRTKQRNRRTATLRLCAEGLGMELSDDKRTTAAALIGFDNYQLKPLRKALQLPAYSTIALARSKAAEEDGTATASFEWGGAAYAFVTDPIRFFNRHIADRSSCTPGFVVGVDRGDGITKIGVTYFVNDIASFVPLAVSTGDDGWTGLSPFADRSLAALTGESELYRTVIGAMQWLIEAWQAWFNGDWNAINALIGLASPAATHGCFVCLATRKQMQQPTLVAPMRVRRVVLSDAADAASTGADARRNHSQMRPPLLLADPDRIVPAPLHAWLGFANLVVGEVYDGLCGADWMQQQRAAVRGAAPEGRQATFALNGPALQAWIDQRRDDAVATRAPEWLRLLQTMSVRFNGERFPVAAPPPSAVPPAERVARLAGWLRALQHHLLHKQLWRPADLAAFQQIIGEIYALWYDTAARPLIPKHHMLLHCAAFAEQHRLLGRLSEAALESSHATFKRAWEHAHRNMLPQPAERLRRSLVSVLLPHLKPKV